MIDTLTKFGTDFQIKCIATLVSDTSFLERIYDILNPKVFESEAGQWIVQEIKDYFLQYKSAPTLSVFKYKVDNLIKDLKDKKSAEILKTSIVNHLRSVYQKTSDSDIQFIKNEFLTFCVNQSMKNAIMESADLVNKGEYNKIRTIVEDALKAGMERDLGHDYVNDIDKRLDETLRKCVMTNDPILDDLLNGGLGKGELAIICAGLGGGKSWLLAKMGAEAVKQGKNVMHFTMELNEEYTGLRYDSYFTGIPFQSIKENGDKIKKTLIDIESKLNIKYFPQYTRSANDLKMYVERYQSLTGKMMDVIIVDYADLLKPETKSRNSDSYSDGGSIYGELRSIAGQLQIPLWSATQSNREGITQDIIEAHHISESLKKAMISDFIFSISRKKQDKVSSVARLHIMKNRFGPDGMTFPAKFNTDCGHLELFDPGSREGLEVQNKMKNSDNSIKSMIKNRWNRNDEEED